MTELVAREIAREDYDRFLAASTPTAFQRSEFLSLVACVHRAELRPLGYFDPAGTLVAAAPFMRRRIGPIHIWGSPLRKAGIPAATPFCVPAGLAAPCLTATSRWVRARRIAFLQASVPADVATSGGDRTEALDNLEVDLDRPLQDIWTEVEAGQKRNFRKAVRSGLRVHWARVSDELIAAYQRLQDETYEKQGVAPNVSPAYIRALGAMQSPARPHVLAATKDGELVSAIWVFVDADAAYYWDAASSQHGRALNANHLLAWTLIRWAHRKRLRRMDFVGTSIGGRGGSRPGIGRFKQSLGARPVAYTIVYWHMPAMQIALALYRSLNRLRALWRQR